MAGTISNRQQLAAEVIRRWLRSWLGIQQLEDKLFPQPKLVSREGKRIEPPSVVSTTTITNNPPVEDKPEIVKGYDAAV